MPVHPCGLDLLGGSCVSPCESDPEKCCGGLLGEPSDECPWLGAEGEANLTEPQIAQIKAAKAAKTNAKTKT
jgi:hypothetical protein